MDKNLFRDVSLERLSSPEQLDELIKVTSPKAWLTLIAIGLILCSSLVWALFGSIPTKIDGNGVLINNGSTCTIQHHTSGQVIDVRFQIGDTVEKGDIVARIDQPELVKEINDLQNSLAGMESSGKADSSEYKDLDDQIASLQTELDYNSQIISQIHGRILGENISVGSVIQQGESLFVLEQYGNSAQMEAVVYIDAEQGESIMPGMEAQICPADINKEEYGYIIGRVISVSEYPVTTDNMMQTLENENLVSILGGKGAYLKVSVNLIPDSKTESGYKWSSSDGPLMTVHSGTIVQSSIITDSQRPIDMLIP